MFEIKRQKQKFNELVWLVKLSTNLTKKNYNTKENVHKKNWLKIHIKLNFFSLFRVVAK